MVAVIDRLMIFYLIMSIIRVFPLKYTKLQQDEFLKVYLD